MGMTTDVEKLLRDGMERFTADVQAPAGLADTVGRLHRRHRAVRAAVACGTAAVTAAAAVAVITGISGGLARHGAGGAQARTVAYVVRRVENALAGEHLVFRGTTTSTSQTSITWAYGPRYRFEEFTEKACGRMLPNLECSGHGGSVPALASGTALIGGKLVGASVTYFDRRYSLSPPRGQVSANACSTTSALVMGGPPMAANHWSDFIHATLACGAANVTGHIRIDGVETTKITGMPVTVRLATGYARAVHERWARARWILYVNPKTYLPVRMYGSTQTFGGPGHGTLFASVTDVRWLPPTAANTAKALVTIPAGFRRVSSPAGQ
jgi:hypothetical protein